MERYILIAQYPFLDSKGIQNFLQQVLGVLNDFFRISHS